MSCGLTKLPDFTTKKVDMLTAAKMLKAAIDKNCKEMGMDPNWETNMATADKYGYGSNDTIVVNFEAGPYDWGVKYSMGSNSNSFDPSKNPNDWYLECYYGFDVMFTPTNDNPKKYKNVVVGKAPSKGMNPKMTCEEKQVKVRVGHNLLSKEHLNKSEEELGENISDIQKRVSDRVGKVFDPKTDQYVSIKTKEDA